MTAAKLIVLAIVALLATPAAVYAATFTASRSGKTMVEGHTGYVIFTKQTTTLTRNLSEQGTAVAVLVRERSCFNGVSAIDGVLWFNDQLLVGGNGRGSADLCTIRFPCAGTLYAVNAGDTDPLDAQGNWKLPRARYVESYRIVDPNDLVWVIDLWTTVLNDRVWFINLLGENAALGAQPDTVGDDGSGACEPAVDLALHDNPAGHVAYPNITYNGLFFMRWPHISVKGPTMRYGSNGTNDTDPTTDGNSHPYNPLDTDSGPDHNHQSGRVDIYYNSAARPQPTRRTFYINDVDGSNACFHDHDVPPYDGVPTGCVSTWPYR